MAVYVLYVPTARHTVRGVEMEKLPSIEHTKRILKRRNNTKRSDTYYVVDRERPSDQTRGFFQQADRTGYMRVFLRRAADPVPGLLDTPDEEWILERGGRNGDGVVIRLPWMEGDEWLTAKGELLDVRHDAPHGQSDITPDYEVRQPTEAQRTGQPCRACFMVPSVTGRCGCS